MPSTYYQIFEETRGAKIEKLKSEYSASIQKARVANTAHSNFYNEILKDYLKIEKDLNEYNRVLVDVNHEYKTDNTLSWGQIFESKLKQIMS